MNTAEQPKTKKIKSQKGSIDLTFLILVLLLVTIGLVMLFSSSYAYSYYYQDGNSFHYISRQLVFAILGITAMLIISCFDYHILHKFALPIFGVAIVLLVVVLLMPSREDSKRWINLGFITFQPSEIAKLAVVILFAHLISLNYERMKTIRYGIVPFIVVLGMIAGLMMAEPHLSGTILILAIGVIMMFVGGVNLKWFALAGVIMAAGLLVVVMIPGVIEYAEGRFMYWIDPFSDALGKGFQTIQSLYAIGSGGLMGVGIGNSRQKYLYLPEVQNDFIFAIVCEELGFIGATIILILFALLVWRGFVIAMRCRDRFGSMLAVGFATQVGVQTILNIAVVTNTIPNTGISLPFFSYGGTALVMLLAQMGVILCVSRQSSLEKE